MADAQMLPVFGFAEEKTQALELRTFLNEKGANLTKSGNIYNNYSNLYINIFRIR